MWKLLYESQPRKFLEKLDKDTQKKIIKYLEKIKDNPKRSGKALSANLKGLWRYRVENYRIICDIQNSHLTILVIKINHRKEIYKNR